MEAKDWSEDSRLTNDVTIDFGELHTKQLGLGLGSLLCHMEDVAGHLRHVRERGRGRRARPWRPDGG